MWTLATNEVVEPSNAPAFARAYLTATDLRTTDAMPYGVPKGATGRVAYVYQMQPATAVDTGVNWGVVGGVAIGLAALGYLGWRRVAGLSGAVGPVGGTTTDEVAEPATTGDDEVSNSVDSEALDEQGPGVTDLRVDD